MTTRITKTQLKKMIKEQVSSQIKGAKPIIPNQKTLQSLIGHLNWFESMARENNDLHQFDGWYDRYHGNGPRAKKNLTPEEKAIAIKNMMTYSQNFAKWLRNQADKIEQYSQELNEY